VLACSSTFQVALHVALHHMDDCRLGCSVTNVLAWVSCQCTDAGIPDTQQIWRWVRITPHFQLWACIDDHAAPHSRHSKQLNVAARVTVD